MNAKTLKALKESIAHWERMWDGPDCGERPSARECSLCHLYVDLNCEGCPVDSHTGGNSCDGTPFYRAEAAWRKLNGPSGTLNGWRAVAQKEIDFLKSLLPKGAKP